MVLAAGGMLALAETLVLVTPETHARPVVPTSRSPLGYMRAIARDGIRLAMARPVVKTFIVTCLVTGLATGAWDRLDIPWVIDRFVFPALFGTDDPVVWFGLVGVVGRLLGLAASEIFTRTHPGAFGPGTPARLPAIRGVIQVVAIATFALSGDRWLSFAMLWVRTVAGSVSQPVEAAWLNRHLDPAPRATVLSMATQANSLGQATGGPALGLVGTALRLRAALLGSAHVLAPTVALSRRLIVRYRGPVLAPAD